VRSSSQARQVSRRTHRTRRIWVSEEILDTHAATDRSSLHGHEEDLVALNPAGEKGSLETRPASLPHDVEGES